MPQSIGRSAYVSLGLTGLSLSVVLLVAVREVGWARHELLDLFVARAHWRLASERATIERYLSLVLREAVLTTLGSDEDRAKAVRAFEATHPLMRVSVSRAGGTPLARPSLSASTMSLRVATSREGSEEVTIFFDAERLLAWLRPRAPGDEVLAIVAPDGRPHLPSMLPATGLLSQGAVESTTSHRLSREASILLGLGPAAHYLIDEPLTVGSDASWRLLLFVPETRVTSLQRDVTRIFAFTTLGVALCLAAAVWSLLAIVRRSRQVRRQLDHARLIRELHEKNEKVLANIPAGVALVSEEGRIEDVNPFLRQRLPSLQPESAVESLLRDFEPSSRERALALFERGRQTGEPQVLLEEALPYTLHIVPLDGGSGSRQWLWVIEDLTAIRELEHQLLRAEKLATVGILTSGIAHEIGTPLGVVRARAEHLRTKATEPGPRDGLTTIISQIDRISRIIQQVLDFSRVEPATRRAVDVSDLARATSDLLRYQFEKRKVALEVDVPSDLPPVLANPDELQQVFLNLLMNALDASETGTVSLRARPREDRVEILVSDQGCGIPPEAQHRIFDPFFTTKRRGQGTGLGLSIVARIVRSHEATITIDSEVGVGTRVLLQWPCAKENHAS